MIDGIPGTSKLLRTAEVARDLGVQPDVFLRLARDAGLQPRKKGRHHLWSQGDREVVRAVLEG